MMVAIYVYEFVRIVILTPASHVGLRPSCASRCSAALRRRLAGRASLRSGHMYCFPASAVRPSLLPLLREWQATLAI